MSQLNASLSIGKTIPLKANALTSISLSLSQLKFIPIPEFPTNFLQM